MKLNTYKEIWRKLNARNFGGVLTEPRFRITRSRNVSAYYLHPENEMAFNRDTDHAGLDNRVCTVFHEMVHQYIFEFLNIDYAGHGKLYKTTYSKFITDDVKAEACYLV
jgi:hypothetical protein